jgi:hypothetical protein
MKVWRGGGNGARSGSIETVNREAALLRAIMFVSVTGGKWNCEKRQP